MTVVVVYDSCTKDTAGRKRLKRVCRTCRNYGIAVQDSVYECEVDAAQYRALQKELASRIAPETDSVCFYLLGNHPHSRMERLGKERILWDRETYII